MIIINSRTEARRMCIYSLLNSLSFSCSSNVPIKHSISRLSKKQMLQEPEMPILIGQ